MNKPLLILSALAGLGLCAAGLIVGFGLYNVSAKAGHLPGVSWLLHTTFRNSVSLRAPSMDEAPRLDDPDLIALGAGHYASACAMCHGTPGTPRAATVRAMVPEPPSITEAVQHWRANELHWIVDNGVKMTGMPAWPVRHRDDEVWAVVAWLVAVQNDAAPPVPSLHLTGTAYCQSCHGDIGGPVPRLDIQTPEYLESQLRAYRSGARPSGIMSQAVSLVPEKSFAELARKLTEEDAAERPVSSPAADGPGAALARYGTRDVPSCLACHGSDADKGPALSGQREAFLAGQLRLWRDGTYTHDALMVAAARELTDEDIALLSQYFASRPE